MEAGSLVRYFKILTENTNPLLWLWLAPWNALRGALLCRVEREEGQKVQINIQKALEYLERNLHVCQSMRRTRSHLQSSRRLLVVRTASTSSNQLNKL